MRKLLCIAKRHKALFGFCGAVGLMWQTADVQSACKPFKPDPVFIADLRRGDFFKRFSGTARETTPGAREKLRALAEQPQPEQIGELATLEGYWRLMLNRPMPYEVTQAAPFSFAVNPRRFAIADEVVKLEFDADSDGKPEWSGSPEGLSVPYVYTYRTPGNYVAAFRFYDRGGAIQQIQTRLRILNTAAFDAEVQTVWRDMREALRRGDLSAALDCIHTQSRATYKEGFAAIPDLSRQVNQVLLPIKLVRVDGGEAVYESVDRSGKESISFEVRFNIDYDAVWRVRSF